MSLPRLFRIATSTPRVADRPRERSDLLRSRRSEIARAARMQRNQIHERLAASRELRELTRRARARSFTPCSMTYSNVTRRSKTRAASIT